MIKIFKKLILTILACITVVSLLFAGCSTREVEVIKGGLKITSSTSGTGPISESNYDETLFSYNINLTNENQKSIFIKSVQPIVNETIKNRVVSKEILVNVNKDVKANETISISGEIIINTKGLSKSDVMQLKPFITDMKVLTEETLSFNQ